EERLVKGTGRIGKSGEIAPFAITSFPSVPFSHANVQRGLAAAPLQSRLPAEIGPEGPIFFSRSKTTPITVDLF
ncbi:hypothetical protein C5973_13260, partial [Cronobacter sakazakii]|uniref:hypothetical protein n=1 Tax=Cronobacter sakazakii TaxID=28141 RepID=UPI000D44617C